MPGTHARGLQGGALWYDGLMVCPQRIVMEMLRWATAEGATVLNRVEARDLEVVAGEVRGLRCVDRLTNAEVRFRSSVVVNCAGPWSREVALAADPSTPEPSHPSLALNLLLDCEPDFDVGAALTPHPGEGNTYFLYPCHGGVMAGTFHAAVEGDPSDAEPGSPVIDAFLGEIRRAAPTLEVDAHSIRRVLWGRLPVRRRGTVELTDREWIYDHGRRSGPRGFVSVSE